MLVFIWANLLFFLSGNIRGANSSASPGAVETETQEQCHDGFCITLSKDTIKAVAGLCVVVPCSFTPVTGFKTDRMIWKYNGKVVFHSTRPGDVSAGFKGRTRLLETNITGRGCSFIISDLTQSDSGSYQFRIEGSDKFTFPFDTRVTVSALSQKPTVKAHPLTEGRETSLTCTAPALCAGTPPKIIWTWRGKGENVSHIPSTIISNFTKYLTFGTQRHRSMVNFTPSAEHHGTEVTCRVNFTDNISSEETVTLNVTYLKDPRITGNTVVAEGDALNLTCSVDSYPPSHITWTTAEPDKRLQAGSGKARLIIPAVKREHSGRYTCTAEHLNKSLTASVEVTLMVRPTILNGSECVLQSGALTCLCISQGVPLPSIKWPLREKSSEYIITTSLSSIQRFTINETISLPLKDQDTTTVECFSSNQVGDMRKDLTVTKTPPLKQQDRHEESPLSIIKLEIILAFLVGVVLSATICYLTTTCLRSQKRNCRSLPESAEMMTCQDQQSDAGRTLGDNQAQQQQVLDEGAESQGAQTSVAVGNPTYESGPNEENYANVDFSILIRKGPEEAQKMQGLTETEYAEITRVKDTLQDAGGKNGERMIDGEAQEDKEEAAEEEEEEEEAMIGADEKASEDEALYSNLMIIKGKE